MRANVSSPWRGRSPGIRPSRSFHRSRCVCRGSAGPPPECVSGSWSGRCGMEPSVMREVQRLPISLQEAWRFFSDPRNLPRITPPSLGLEVMSDLPGEMYPGMITHVPRPPDPVDFGGRGSRKSPTYGCRPCSSTNSGSDRTGSGTTSTTSGRSKGASKWKTSSTTPSRSARSGRCSAVPRSGAGLERIFAFRRRFLAGEFGPEVHG